MAFQSSVAVEQPLGVVGDYIWSGGGNRSKAATLTYETGAVTAINRVGRVCTYVTVGTNPDNYVRVGGEGALAGIIVNTKTLTRTGLGADLIIADNTVIEVCSSTPGILVEFTTAATYGQVVIFSTVTGEIQTRNASDSNPANFRVLPNARIIDFNTTTANTVSALELSGFGDGSTVA